MSSISPRGSGSSHEWALSIAFAVAGVGCVAALARHRLWISVPLGLVAGVCFALRQLAAIRRARDRRSARAATSPGGPQVAVAEAPLTPRRFLHRMRLSLGLVAVAGLVGLIVLDNRQRVLVGIGLILITALEMLLARAVVRRLPTDPP